MEIWEFAQSAPREWHRQPGWVRLARCRCRAAGAAANQRTGFLDDMSERSLSQEGAPLSARGVSATAQCVSPACRDISLRRVSRLLSRSWHGALGLLKALRNSRVIW